MRAGAVKPESAKPAKSANGGAGGGAVRGALVSSTRKGSEAAKTAQSAEIVQSSESKSGTLKTEVNGSVQTNRQKHIGRAEALKTAQDKGSEITITTPAGGTEFAETVQSVEIARTATERGVEVVKTVQGRYTKIVKTSQDIGSVETTRTAPAGGAEVVKTEISRGTQTGRGSNFADAEAHPIPAKRARVPAKNKTAPQNGAELRGLEDALAPAFPRRRLTSSEVKQLVDQAMEKLKEERPADYALLYELYFNRVPLRSLSRTLRIPRSTLRYRKRLALGHIKQIIEENKFLISK